MYRLTIRKRLFPIMLFIMIFFTGNKVHALTIISVNRTIPAETTTNAASVGYTVTFSEAVAGLTVGNFTVPVNGISGAGVTSVTGSGSIWMVTVGTGSGDGTLGLTMENSTGVTDTVGNAVDNLPFIGEFYTIDKTAPTATISSSAADPTNSAPIPVTVTFSEAVTGFESGDITVGNGTIGSFTGSGAVYTFTVTPTTNGPVTVDIGAGVAHDGAGNGNSAATQLSRTYDNNPPTMDASAAYVDSTHVDVTFSETVVNANIAANYTSPGLTVTGAALQSGTTYRLTTSLQGIGASYTITANNITDTAGNPLNSNARTATFTRTSASNSAPTIPTLNAPPNGSPNLNEVATIMPVLVVNNSTDPDSDPISYIFEIDTVNSFDSIDKKTSPVIVQGSGTTSWTIPSSTPLTDNTMWYWRVLATDGDKSSNYMTTTASFFVNTVNDAPAGLAVSSPANDPKTEVTELQPFLTVTNATDVDRDTITYEFEVATDNSFAHIVARSAADMPQGEAGTTAWKVAPALSDNTQYYWRSRARDQHGLAGTWVTAPFFTNTANDAPTAPTLNAPAIGGPNSNNEISTTFTPTLTVNNATDPDLDPLTYTFEIDTVITFNSPNKQTSLAIAEVAGSTTISWVPAALSDNTLWYWRVKATDIHQADSTWMAAGSFFVNMANDAPNVPTITNPANNGEVSSLTPTLTVNAIDIDSDPLTYEFSVYSDSSPSPAKQVAGATDQGPSWTVTPPLVDNTRYYWIARAKDVHNVYSGWTGISSFIVKNKMNNQPPTIQITAPGQAEPVTNAKTYTIRWNAADPDSPALITLYYDNNNSGNDGTLIVAGISKDVNSYTWDTSALGDGSYYVYGKIEDGNSTVYAYSAGPLVIDRTAPVVPIVVGITPTSNTRPSWNWSSGGGDGNGTFRYKLGDSDLNTGATQTTATTFTPAAALGEGPHTLYVQERDAVGNWSDAGSFAIEVDTIAPGASIGGAPSGETQATSATLTVGGGGVVAYKYQHRYLQSVVKDFAEEIPVTVPINLSALGDGGHTIAVIGRDSAGNWQATTSATTASWVVDVTAPAVTLSGVPPALTNAASVTLTVTNGDVVEYRYKLDDGGYSAAIQAATPISLISLGEGKHTVSVMGRDSAGNWQAEANATPASWTVDLTPPVLEVDPIFDDKPTNNQTLTITGKATDNLGPLTLTIQGLPVEIDADNKFNHSVTLVQGNNAIAVVASDGAGNRTEVVRNKTLDLSAPNLTVDKPAQDTKTNLASIDVEGTINEAVDKVDVEVYDAIGTLLSTQPASVATDDFTSTVTLARGKNYIVVTATDLAGNTSTNTVSSLVTFDDQGPSLTITDPPQDLRTLEGVITLKGSVSDALTKIVAVDVSQNGIDIGSPQLTSGSSDQTFEQELIFTVENALYKIIVTATDEAGNKTSVQRNIIKADPPIGDLDSDGEVTLRDALFALRIAVGLQLLKDSDLIYGDVAPFYNGSPCPDGRIDVGDAVIILKMVAGIIPKIPKQPQ